MESRRQFGRSCVFWRLTFAIRAAHGIGWKKEKIAKQITYGTLCFLRINHSKERRCWIFLLCKNVRSHTKNSLCAKIYTLDIWTNVQQSLILSENFPQRFPLFCLQLFPIKMYLQYIRIHQGEKISKIYSRKKWLIFNEEWLLLLFGCSQSSSPLLHCCPPHHAWRHRVLLLEQCLLRFHV